MSDEHFEPFIPEDLVWENSLDGGKFYATVIRTGDHKGALSVTEGITLIHAEDVGLSHDAIFGPDADDVAAWMDRVIDVVDHPEKRTTEVPRP